MSSITRFLSLSLLFNTSCLLLSMQAMAEVRDVEAYFFHESFGNFAEELVNAKDEGKKAVLLMFQQQDCPYCERMRTTVLNQKRVQDYYRENFLIFHVDIEGDIEITDFNGQPARVQIENQQYAAMVTSLGMRPHTGAKDGYYQLEVEFELRPDDVLRAGQAATIRLP